MSIRHGIYIISNKRNGKSYIGSAIDVAHRRAEHFYKLRNNKHPNKHLQNAWNKYGETSFLFSVLEYVGEKRDLVAREQYFINQYKSANRRYGYNLRPTAKSNVGIVWSPQTKERMSLAHQGKCLGSDNPRFGIYGTVVINGSIYSKCKRGHVKVEENKCLDGGCKRCKREDSARSYLISRNGVKTGSKGSFNSFFGKTHSLESRFRISLTQRLRSYLRKING